MQRPEDIIEARERIGDRARIIAKLEKPSAVERLDEIIAQADALMVARGDLGVELPAEQVPAIQIVATQMLESMIESPVPTRAEASDVATAIYDGADAVMLSAESATGKHPQAAVAMMSRIIEGTEADPQYRQLIDASHSPPCRASRTRPRPCAARCATPPRCSRRPRSSLHQFRRHQPARGARTAGGAGAQPHAQPGARRLTLVWGVHSVHVDDVADIAQSTRPACAVATQERFCSAGQTLAIIAGMPFGKAGTTNLLRIATA